uniref:Uncharacterized protein n=1 Tax=Plectus sambesii TaxID=2011161 RepID=A0A914WCN7_9BILA
MNPNRWLADNNNTPTTDEESSQRRRRKIRQSGIVLGSFKTFEEPQRRIRDSQGVIGLSIKWRSPFFTDIRRLAVPIESALVGVFGTLLWRHMGAAKVNKFACFSSISTVTTCFEEGSTISARS